MEITYIAFRSYVDHARLEERNVDVCEIADMMILEDGHDEASVDRAIARWKEEEEEL